MHLPDDQAGLRVFIVFAGVVGHDHIALQTHRLFVLGQRAHIERPPRQAAGQIRDLHRHTAADFALNVPYSHVLHPRRVRQVGDVDLIGVRRGLHRQARRVDQGIRPRKLQLVVPFLERQRTPVPHQRQVGGIVNGQLRHIPTGQRNQIDLAERNACQCHQNGYRCFRFHDHTPV